MKLEDHTTQKTLFCVFKFLFVNGVEIHGRKQFS